jgi:AraC-like DNA-binding protein
MKDFINHYNIDADVIDVDWISKLYNNSPWFYDNSKQKIPLRKYFYELSFITEGSHRLIQGDLSEIRDKYSLILKKPSFAKFRVENVKLPYSYFTYHFYTATPIDIDFKNSRSIAVKPDNFNEVEAEFIKAHTIFNEQKFGYKLDLKISLLKMLKVFFKNYYDVSLDSASYHSIDNSIHLLNEAVNNGDNISDIAKKLNFSVEYFIRNFKKHTGITPKQYINNLRIERSIIYLTNSSMSITEIADLLNFSDSNHFSKMFKQKYNMSPTEYRKKR